MLPASIPGLNRSINFLIILPLALLLALTLIACGPSASDDSGDDREESRAESSADQDSAESTGEEPRSDRDQGDSGSAFPIPGQSQPTPDSVVVEIIVEVCRGELPEGASRPPDADNVLIVEVEVCPDETPAAGLPFGGQSEPQPTNTPQPTATMSGPTPTPTPELPSGSPDTDRAVLVALYEATNGDSWKNVDGWLSANPLNQWYGVQTNSYGRVTGLNLAGNELSGEIPTELADLSALEELRLGDSLVAQSRAGCHYITDRSALIAAIQVGQLRPNQLTGEIPPELGNLSNLRVMNLGYNQLTGEIPPELGRLSNLQGLYLDENQLSGGIPPELGNLSNLQRLGLGRNRLSGEIPPELGSLLVLQHLELCQNQLTGEIPPELDNLDSLNIISIQDHQGQPSNQVTGCVSHFLSQRVVRNILPICPEHPEERAVVIALYEAWGIGAGTQRFPTPAPGTDPAEYPILVHFPGVTLSAEGRVIVLDLRGRDLRGEIPLELAALTHLRHLDLSNNNLRGEIPDQLEALTSLKSLNLTNNNLTCIPSQLQERSQEEDPQKFLLDGSLPPC